ncbi:MAG: hypothetical protein C4297_14680 [Gemmataceae bacterium]
MTGSPVLSHQTVIDVERAHRRVGILRKETGFPLAAVAGLSISPEAGELTEKLALVRVSGGPRARCLLYDRRYPRVKAGLDLALPQML